MARTLYICNTLQNDKWLCSGKLLHFQITIIIMNSRLMFDLISPRMSWENATERINQQWQKWQILRSSSLLLPGLTQEVLNQSFYHGYKSTPFHNVHFCVTKLSRSLSNKIFNTLSSAFIHVLCVARHFVTECACSEYVAMERDVVSYRHYVCTSSLVACRSRILSSSVGFMKIIIRRYDLNKSS